MRLTLRMALVFTEAHKEGLGSKPSEIAESWAWPPFGTKFKS